jgi:hypothetical protein
MKDHIIHLIVAVYNPQASLGFIWEMVLVPRGHFLEVRDWPDWLVRFNVYCF